MRQVGASALLPCLVYRLESRLLLMTSPRDVSGWTSRRFIERHRTGSERDGLRQAVFNHCGGFC